ncbi:MAG: carboxypeptidase-like regulatory domain-containing protein, partial [Kofleriaceae bacterium]
QPAPDERDAPPTEGPAAMPAPAIDDRAPRAGAIGDGAMPGGLHVASAEALPLGSLEISALSGAGYRKGLLGPGHTLQRASGGLAIAYAPASRVVVSLALDGRFDQHTGLVGMTGDGYAGDLHARARYVARRGRIALGGQLGVWLPGDGGPPSFALAATSVEARGLLALELGTMTLSLDAGFRLDRSAALVDRDHPPSIEHRVSLGASDFHAVLAGAQLRVPIGDRWYAALEGSTEAFVGAGAPGPIVRGGGMVGVALPRGFAIVGYVGLARVPKIGAREVMAGQVPLIPYEPTVTGGLGVQARFGDAPHARAARPSLAPVASVVAIETAAVHGVVVDDRGTPIAGAHIAVTLKDHTGTTVTDARGGYTLDGLPIGKTVDGATTLDDAVAQIAAEIANKRSGSTIVTLARGPNAAPAITLDPLLPPGQLRAVIVNVASGRPVAGAALTIDPGGITATSGPDGKVIIDLAPGHYQVTVTARGLAPQRLDVTIEEDGVAIKNIDMHR